MIVYVSHTPEIIQSCVNKVKNRHGLSYLDINGHSILIPTADCDPLHVMKKLKTKNGYPERIVYLGLGLSKILSGPHAITSFATLINDKLEPVSENFLAFERGTCLSTKGSSNHELIDDLFNTVDCIEANCSRWYLCCEALGIPFTCSMYLQQKPDTELAIEPIIKALLDKKLHEEESKEYVNKKTTPDNLIFHGDLYWTKSLKTKYEKAYATFLKNNNSNGTEQIKSYLAQFTNESPKIRTVKLVQFLEQQNSPEVYSRLSELEQWSKINSQGFVHFNYDKKLESSKITVSFDFFSEKGYQEKLQVLRDADIAAFIEIIHPSE